MAISNLSPARLALSCALIAAVRQAAAQDVAESLSRLRASAAIERARGEAEIVAAGIDALPALARELDAEDRPYRLRVERAFLGVLDGLLSTLDNEHTALTLDENELAALREHQRFAAERKELMAQLDAARLKDPEITSKRDALLVLERLEAREKRAQAQQGPELGEEAREELVRLRAQRDEWRRSRPGFDDEIKPFLRLARLEGLGGTGVELSELELIRLKELEERVADRAPRVQAAEARLEALGFPAYNALLARAVTARERSLDHYRRLVARHLQAEGESLIPPPGDLERVRYQRGLLWLHVESAGGPRAEAAAAAIRRHLELTLADLKQSDALVRERAQDELYLLGERGREALRGPSGDGEPFLRGLLDWRIRPRTYARTGIDFQDFDRLDFRQKRRRLFAYAIAAEAESLPTLRAVITDDRLGQSFQVKLAAAKAMAGQRDMSGYNFLIVKHPDLTLKKPEVSREILIIQGNEHLRDKNYDRAVEDLQKVLDEHPFDFQANYYIAFSYLLLKRYAKAIHHFEIARRVNPEDELTLYNLACAYALHGGKTQEAIDALEGAVGAGFTDYEHMEKDPDLDSLRSDDRYRQLIARLRGDDR